MPSSSSPRTVFLVRVVQLSYLVALSASFACVASYLSFPPSRISPSSQISLPRTVRCMHGAQAHVSYTQNYDLCMQLNRISCWTNNKYNQTRLDAWFEHASHCPRLTLYLSSLPPKQPITHSDVGLMKLKRRYMSNVPQSDKPNDRY